MPTPPSTVAPPPSPPPVAVLLSAIHPAECCRLVLSRCCVCVCVCACGCPYVLVPLCPCVLVFVWLWPIWPCVHVPLRSRVLVSLKFSCSCVFMAICPCCMRGGVSIPFHSIPFCSIPFHSTPFRSTSFHSTPFHIPLHSIPLHSTPLHSTPFHSPCGCVGFVCGCGRAVGLLVIGLWGCNAAIQCSAVRCNTVQ